HRTDESLEPIGQDGEHEKRDRQPDAVDEHERQATEVAGLRHRPEGVQPAANVRPRRNAPAVPYTGVMCRRRSRARNPKRSTPRVCSASTMIKPPAMAL